MEMDAFRIFIDAANTHSFTDAARLHGCTLANASHQFHSVEKASARRWPCPVSTAFN